MMNNKHSGKSRLSSLRAGLRQLSYAILATLPMLGSVQAATDEFVYFHTDALGSPTAAFNEAGEVCWTETYSPYGEKLDKEDSLTPVDGCGLLGTDVGYTGHVQDGSGLVYAQQRYYDPVIGRFMSTDPTKPSAGDPRYFGRYQYGGNNPYKYTDPSGELVFLAALPPALAPYVGPAIGAGLLGTGLANGWDPLGAIGGFFGGLFNENSEETTDDVDRAREIANGIREEYGKKNNYKCDDCADKIEDALKEEGISGTRVEVQHGSDMVHSDKARKNISKNGYHVGIQVGDTVFDNHGDSSRSDWESDQHSQSGTSEVKETEF